MTLWFLYPADMVHNCVVPGCSSRSDKKECKGIKFYRLPTAKKTLERWLLLIGRKISEVSLHSRICSKHFIGGKKMIPQLFPWQKRSNTLNITHSTSTITLTNVLSPSDIVNHDHCYCLPCTEQSQLQPTHLTPLPDSSASVDVSSSLKADVATQTYHHSALKISLIIM